jgi:hypothetical protein
VFVVLVNRNNDLLVENEWSSVAELREKAKEFISTDKMMRTEIQDFMFFFGDAKTSREPLE